MKRWLAKRIGKLRRSTLYGPEWDEAPRALKLLRERGFRPAAIIDIGAYRGQFTRRAKRVFPDARAVMLEANPDQEPDLREVAERLGDSAAYKICLLGSERKDTVQFFRGGTGSSIYREMTNVPMEETSLAMSTLDDELADLDIKAPILLKIDVQGAEIDVLSGGPRILAAAEVVFSECSVLEYNRGGAQIAEVIAWMDRNGFVLYDICQIMRLPDRNLNQLDVVFVRKDSQLRRSGQLF